MHVGLIVGIGPTATDLYYRSLITALAARGVDLELTMAHADAPTLLRNQASGDADAQVAIYGRLTGRLQAAGASAVAVTSIAGHFCIDAFKPLSPLPVIDMLVEVDRGVGREGALVDPFHEVAVEKIEPDGASEDQGAGSLELCADGPHATHYDQVDRRADHVADGPGVGVPQVTAIFND